MRGFQRALDRLPGSVGERLHAIKHQIYWLTKGAKLHQAYFEDYQTRSEPVVKLLDWLTINPRSDHRVLEFGCSGGNNLRLIREMVSFPIRYVGFDIQPGAIAFADSHFPHDLFIVGDDKALLEQAESLGRFDAFLASSVLCYLPERRCLAVLSMAARVADVVVVCDVLSRIDDATGLNDGLFLHPYSRLCDEAGLQIVDRAIHGGDRRFSTFVACPNA